VLRTYDAVQSAIEAYRDYPGGIVVHGTPRIVQAGEVIEPQTCKTPTRDVTGRWINWENYTSYVFAAPPECPDHPTFYATVKFNIPSYTAGVRAEGSDFGDGRLILMANDEVKSIAKRRNHIGTLCILPAQGFGESPKGSWAEVVRSEEVRVIGAFAVHYTALSVELNSLPPLSIPGVSEDELRMLAAAAREAVVPSV